MDVLIVTLFASLLFVLGAVVFFAWNVAQRSHEHIDRLAILPLQGEPSTQPVTDTPENC